MRDVILELWPGSIATWLLEVLVCLGWALLVVGVGWLALRGVAHAGARAHDRRRRAHE